MTLIGYQGIKGSNSEFAAQSIAQKQGLSNPVFIPLVSSFNVLESISQGVVDYGVIAMHNNTGGHVKESVHALKHIDVDYVNEVTLGIEHYLYVKDSSIKKQDVTQITSHLQALVQCEYTLKTHFPKVPLMADEDTATAAMKLRLELLPSTSAVLCRKEAGTYNNLYLLEEHLEDNNDNTTTFHMYKNKE
jgi:prephenate dehydratase